jgi:dipeptidyl aminopeptidase/acylaminoacyl peptidase
VLILSLFLLTLAPLAQGEVGRDLAVEEYLQLRRPTAVSVAADGKAVALSVRSADLEANRFVEELYVWRAGGTERVSPDFPAIEKPRWSRNGRRIGFLAADAAPAPAPEEASTAPALQLWTVEPPPASTARRITEFEGGVVDYDWAPDGSVYVLARQGPGSATALWKIIMPGDSAERVWGGERGIGEMALSPDGRLLAYTVDISDPREPERFYDLRILDLQTQRSRRLTRRPGSEVGPVWTSDGSAIVFQAPEDPNFANGQVGLFRVAAEGGEPRSLTDSFDRSVLDHRCAGDDIIFGAAIGVRNHLFVLRRDGSAQSIAAGEPSYGAFDVAAGSGGEIFAVRESADEPPELWALGGARPDRVTDLNAEARDWLLPRQQLISWRAADGLSIEGLLVYPAGFERGRRYPLLVHPAGGAGTRAIDAFAQSAAYRLFAARGYAVLVPNLRGSEGYGRDFAAFPSRGPAGGVLADLMAGIDHVVEMGIADSVNIGIYGSGGPGDMAGWLLTRTPRLRAALIQQGIGGLVYPEGSDGSDAPRSDRLAKEAQENAGRIQGAVLIATAGMQRNTERPVQDARVLYRRLEDLGKTVELVELGDEVSAGPRGHADLFLRALRWMDRFLKLGGAELFEFYMVGESVPGPEGWTMRVRRAEPDSGYATVAPDSGRYLEVDLAFEPEPSGGSERLVPGFQFDPASAIQLVGPTGEIHRAAGTVTDLLGEETLVPGMPAAFTVPEVRRGSPPALVLTLAFEIPDGGGLYRLMIEGFQPVRIWVPKPVRGGEADR